MHCLIDWQCRGCSHFDNLVEERLLIELNSVVENFEMIKWIFYVMSKVSHRDSLNEVWSEEGR